MMYGGERYVYLGFIKKTHGDKGKVILVPRRSFNPQHVSRIFIKDEQGMLEEYRLRLAKKYKNFYILRLSKIRSKEDAEHLISRDVYLKEMDLPRKIRVEFGLSPSFVEEITEIPEGVENIGFVTKPRGLHGQLAAIIDGEKFGKLEEGKEIYIMTADGKYYRTKIRTFKKIRGEEKVYVSLKLMNVDDVDSAERLRKALLFI